MIEIGKIKTKRVLANKIRPYISVKFAGYPHSSVPAELIPMLVINSQYENKKRIPASERETLELICDGSIKKTGHAFGASNILLTDGKIKVVIPCLELARTLFLHNIHLTRTALRPNALRGMALANEGGDVSTINFNRMSDYPLKNLNSKSACYHLIWLMFDKEASKSFGSIYGSLQASKKSSWSFDFTPPPLHGWGLKLTGQYDESDSKLFYVYEIKGVHNPSFDYSKIVHIYHPNKKEPISVAPLNGKRPEVSMPDPDPQLNLQAIPSKHRKRDLVTETGFSFTFGSEINAKIMPGKPDKRVSPIVNREQLPIPDESGVGHSTEKGEAQELDWAINRDDITEPETETKFNNVEATGQFLLFEEVVELLMQRSEYKYISIHCMELPKPSNNSTMYLNKNTTKRRTFHCAQFIFQQLPLMIVEVDLSDYPKKRRLSSRVFGFVGDPEEGFHAVMQSCSDAGVHWNQTEIDLHTCVDKPIKHPIEYIKVDNNKQQKTQQDILTSWVNNIDKCINSIDSNVL